MSERFDFGIFHSDDSTKRAELASKLVATLKQYGYARLTNHGVPSSDIQQAFDTTRDFFQLPVEEKLKSPHPPTPNPHRGYSAFGIEKVAVSGLGSSALKDMKESYDIGSERDPLYGNIWPPPGVHDAFETTFTSFFNSCYNSQLQILKAISVGLGLETQTLGKLHVDQTNELRLTHYPAVSRSEFSHSTRIATHTDFGTITLLFQDSVGGLQIELPPWSNNFVEIDSGGPYECILLVGDCLGKMTGLPGARHRVHLPELPNVEKGDPSKNAVDARYSIAYFAKPDRAASLRPLLGEVKEGEAYLTAGEFQDMRIRGTY